jgi:type IX secretion system PorP/SprF family membrane protein
MKNPLLFKLSPKALKYKLILLLIILPLSSVGQDAIFSQFFSVPLYLNPAFAGTRDCPRINANYRNQPFPGFGTFSTFNLSYDQRVDFLGGGLGFMITSDHQGGIIMKNQLSAIYSYHLRVSENLSVNFGAQAGYYRKDLNWNRLEFMDQWNPFTGEINPQTEIPPDRTWRHSANFAAGVLVYTDDFFGGVAVHHLTQPQESFFGDFRLPIKYTAHLGMNLFGSPDQGLYFSPNVIAQSQGEFSRLNYGFYAGLEPLMAGMWFRQSLKGPNALIFMFGMDLGNYLVAYSYDYSLSGFSGPLQGAHEISVSLNLHCGEKNMKYRILNCPPF